MIKGYYFITDSGLSKHGNLNDVKAAIKAGVGIVQYRNKADDVKAMHEEARILKDICRGIKFIVNDNIDVACSVNADGLHVGQKDIGYEIARNILGWDKIIGVTVRNIKEAIAAEKNGADYLGVGPVFKTATKQDAGEPCGVGLIKEIRNVCRIPITAIGGITLENCREVIEAGADAISAISAVVTKDDIKVEIEKFQELFKR